MKRTLASLAVAALAIGQIVRAKTHDIAFTFRMGAGFPGDVNRTHPASIVPGLVNSSAPVAFYGFPAVIDGATSSYRGLSAGDTALTSIDGVLARPYPTQQMTGGMSSSIGAAAAPTSGVADFLEDGFIIAQCNNFAAQPPQKGGAVYVWIAASTGNHVQGGFEAAAGGGSNTILLTNARWNGPTDANGVTEIRVTASK